MFHKLVKTFVGSPLLIYTFRCLIGFFIGYLLYTKYPEFELFWTMLSIILVISPEEKDSRKLSIERFKSNFIGSIVALACLYFLGSSFYVMLLGIVITIAVCRLFQVMNMARVALVALIIIMVQPHDSSIVETPILRCVSVAFGCIIGLLIVVFSSMLFRPLKRKYGIEY